MPPRADTQVLQPKTRAQALAECLKTLFCCGADAMSVNNAGVFHDSNLSHVNQGNYSTFNQGSTISGNTFVNANTVQNVNENGVSGALLTWISPLFIPDYTTQV